jgi:hypothetical protein
MVSKIGDFMAQIIRTFNVFQPAVQVDAKEKIDSLESYFAKYNRFDDTLSIVARVGVVFLATVPLVIRCLRSVMSWNSLVSPWQQFLVGHGPEARLAQGLLMLARLPKPVSCALVAAVTASYLTYLWQSGKATDEIRRLFVESFSQAEGVVPAGVMQYIAQDPIAVRQLIEKGVDLAKMDKKSRTLLNCALGEVTVEGKAVLNLLLENGMKISNKSFAAMLLEPDLSFAQEVLEKGYVKVADFTEAEIAHMWIQVKGSKVAKLLVKHGFDINSVSEKGDTALFWALKSAVIGEDHNSNNNILLLLEHGAKVPCLDEELTVEFKWDKETFNFWVSKGEDQGTWLLRSGEEVVDIDGAEAEDFVKTHQNITLVGTKTIGDWLADEPVLRQALIQARQVHNNGAFALPESIKESPSVFNIFRPLVDVDTERRWEGFRKGSIFTRVLGIASPIFVGIGLASVLLSPKVGVPGLLCYAVVSLVSTALYYKYENGRATRRLEELAKQAFAAPFPVPCAMDYVSKEKMWSKVDSVSLTKLDNQGNSIWDRILREKGSVSQSFIDAFFNPLDADMKFHYFLKTIESKATGFVEYLLNRIDLKELTDAQYFKCCEHLQDVQTARLLRKQGLKTEVRNQGGFTSLLKDCHFYEKVKVLIAAGANLEAKVMVKNKDGVEEEKDILDLLGDRNPAIQQLVRKERTRRLAEELVEHSIGETS